MKKTYIIPQALQYSTQTTSCLLAGSGGVQGTNEYDIVYGGVDTEGNKDPAAKLGDFFVFEEEETADENEYQEYSLWED